MKAIIVKIDGIINALRHHTFEGILLCVISFIGMLLGYSMQLMSSLLSAIALFSLTLGYLFFCLRLLYSYWK